MTNIDDLEDRISALEELNETKEIMLQIVEKHLQAALTEIMELKIKLSRDEGITDAY